MFIVRRYYRREKFRSLGRILSDIGRQTAPFFVNYPAI